MTLLSENDAPAQQQQDLQWLTEFRPRRFLSNGHLQTIVGNYLPRQDALPAPETSTVEVEAAGVGGEGLERRAASYVLCECHWQPADVRAQRLTVLILHGLEGSSRSQYVVGNANKFWRAGWNIIRMNMRNCGSVAPGGMEPDETAEPGEAAGPANGMAPAGISPAGISPGGAERLAASLYHSGMSGDVLAVCRHFIRKYGLGSIALVGYSMGGNLVLKLAGEVTPETFPELRAVVGVSPAVDLAASADALHEGPNRLYEWKFLSNMKRRFRRKATVFPALYSATRLDEVHTLRQFDDRITAYYEGFTGADDYYYRAAAARVVDRIAVPTLVLHAQDDPFIRLQPETAAKMRANPHVTLVETQHGGHCAFLADPVADPIGAMQYDGYWAEATLLAFITQQAGL